MANFLGGIIVLCFSSFIEFDANNINIYKNIFLPEVLFSWLWLVIVGSGIGFVLYIYLLKNWEAVKVSHYYFLTPVVAIIFNYILFKESLK